MADSWNYPEQPGKRQKTDHLTGLAYAAAQSQQDGDRAYMKQQSGYEFSQHKMNNAVAAAQHKKPPASKIAIRHAAGAFCRRLSRLSRRALSLIHI